MLLIIALKVALKKYSHGSFYHEKMELCFQICCKKLNQVHYYTEECDRVCLCRLRLAFGVGVLLAWDECGPAKSSDAIIMVVCVCEFQPAIVESLRALSTVR